MQKKYKLKKLLVLSITSALIIGSFANPVEAKTPSVDEIYSAAYKATMNALKEKTQKSVNEARKAISNLKSAGVAWAVGEFSKQVDSVQHTFLVKVVKAIDTAKATPTQSNINAARQAVDPDFPLAWKNSYNSAIDKIQQGLIDKAWTSYIKASESKNLADVQAVSNLIADLKTASSANVVSWAKALEQKVESIVVDPTSIPVVAPGDIVTLPIAVPKGYTGYLLPSIFTTLENLIYYPDKAVIKGDGKTNTAIAPIVQGKYSLSLVKDGVIEKRYDDIVYVSLGVKSNYSDYKLTVASGAIEAGWLTIIFDNGEGENAISEFQVNQDYTAEKIAKRIEAGFDGTWFTDNHPYKITANGTVVTITTNTGATPSKPVSLTIN